MLKQVPEQGRVRQTLWESTHIARWTAISLWIVQQSLWQEASANIPPSDDTCSPCRQEVRVLHLSKEVGCLNPKSLTLGIWMYVSAFFPHLDMCICRCCRITCEPHTILSRRTFAMFARKASSLPIPTSITTRWSTANRPREHNASSAANGLAIDYY